MNSRWRTLLGILSLFLISAVVMLRQLSSGGYFSVNINDSVTYAGWTWQFVEAVKEGIVYPRWTPLNFWGYGSPTFVYYPPLSYYLSALFNVFTGSIIAAMNLAKFTAFFLSAAGMFFLVREFYPEKIALPVASVFLLFPFNVFEFYFAGTFASVLSLMWFAPLFLFTYRYIEKGQYRQILYAGACYCGLILTHLINAYMFTFVLVVFSVYMSVIKEDPRYIAGTFLIICIGVLLSAAYLLPALYEKQFINLEGFVGVGGFRFIDYFIFPDLTDKLPPDHFWAVYHNTFLFHTSLFCLLAALSFFHLSRSKCHTAERVHHINMFFLGLSMGSVFLLFGASGFLWKLIPFFEYIQFPVRWLNITAFAGVFLFASGFRVMKEIWRSGMRSYVVGGICLVCLCILMDYRYIGSAHVFAEQELLPVKEVNFTPEHLPSGINMDRIDRNSGEEDKAVIVEGEGVAEISAWKSAERIVEISAGSPCVLRIRTFYFPGWTAYTDGVRTEVKVEQGTGAMLIGVPRGRHTIALRFVDTPIRFYSKIISVVSFFSFTSLAVLLRRKGAKDK